MRPLAVDLVLLRATAPDLPLVVGRVLAARVVERHGQRGIAGAYLTAELPEELQPGDSLRLVVCGRPCSPSSPGSRAAAATGSRGARGGSASGGG
ncbi:MAG: hypothetical protein JSS99_08945 [Actinobacteria bacterium]|nr:hypothetical protein [Actinomycetota bacterium]